MQVSSYAQQIHNYTVNSRLLEKDISYRVTVPSDYTEDRPYYPIYVLDGEILLFPMLGAISLNMIYDYMPESIVISIDYTVPNNREEIGLNSQFLTLSENGKKFQNYITNELIPDVEKRYNVASNRTIVGYSYTATYLITLMQNESSVFDNYILLTPEVTDVSVKELQNKIKTTSQFPGRVVCMAAEHDIKKRKLFASQFSNAMSNLCISDYKLLSGVSHMTAPNRISEALTLLFKDYINEGILDQKYRSKKRGQLNAKELLDDCNNFNMLSYGVPLKLNSGNMIFFMDRALDIDGDKDIARQVLEPFIEEAIVGEDLLQVTNIAYYLNRLDDKKRVDSLYRWGFMVSGKRENVVKSLNVRLNYAREILAKRESKYEDAWIILDSIVNDISDNYQGIVLFFKGEISASYNYKNEQGIAFLESSLDYLNDLSLWGINERKINALINQCKYNSVKTNCNFIN